MRISLWAMIAWWIATELRPKVLKMSQKATEVYGPQKPRIYIYFISWTPLGRSRSGFRIQDRPDHGASKEPINHCPEWMYIGSSDTPWSKWKINSFQIPIWSENSGRIATPWGITDNSHLFHWFKWFWIISPMRSRNNSWANWSFANAAQFCLFKFMFYVSFGVSHFPLHRETINDHLYYNQWQIMQLLAFKSCPWTSKYAVKRSIILFQERSLTSVSWLQRSARQKLFNWGFYHLPWTSQMMH